MNSTIVYETATGIVLACGDVAIDYEKSNAHDSDGRKTIGGGNFDSAISVETTKADVSNIEPLEWRYLPDSDTFEKIIKQEEGMRIGDE